MTFDPDKHHRRSVRLHGWNYAWAGAYFVTICTAGRRQLFGEVIEGQMRLNEYGQIVDEEWLRSSAIRQEIALDQYVVMPNHFHAIVFIYRDFDEDGGRGGRPSAPTITSINDDSREGPPGPTPRSLSTLVRGFKSAAKLRINDLRQSPGTAVWQRSFHDHIIRNDEALNRIRQYISDNPMQWEHDRYFTHSPDGP